MPFLIEIDPSRRRICTRAIGHINGDDLHRYYRDLYAHPDFEPTMSELFDLSEATGFDVPTEDLHAFSMTTALNTCKGNGVRVAIVAPGDLAFGMARMYELTQTRSTNTIRVVRDRGEAESWLSAAEDTPRVKEWS